MEANPHHYSPRAIKTAKHGLSLKGKQPLKVDQVIHEKVQAIKNGFWLAEGIKREQNDIQHLKKMKKDWTVYFSKSLETFERIKARKDPAELKKLLVKLERNKEQGSFFEPRLEKLLNNAKQRLALNEA